MIYTSNPVNDMERDYARRTASARMWENEHYRGTCPFCGKPMYEYAADWAENCKYDDILGTEAHERCSWEARDLLEEMQEKYGDGIDPEEVIENYRVTA